MRTLCSFLMLAALGLAGAQTAQTVTPAAATPVVLRDGPNPLTSFKPLSSSNGWGPVELNRSNGEQPAGDGKALSVGGQAYLFGYGVHSPSDLSFDLGGQCQTFTASVGVDDEVGKQGAVVFSLIGDGKTLYTSAVLKGGDKAAPVNVSVAGVKSLHLVAASGAATLDYSHADWLTPAVACDIWSGPLVITKGGTYTGKWETKDPAKAAVEVQTSEPVTITNSRIRGVGNWAGLVYGFNTRLTITDTTITGVRRPDLGTGVPHAVSLGQPYAFVFEHNLIDHTAGININGTPPTGTQPDPLRVEALQIRYNRSTNADGRLSDGHGGFQKLEGQRQIVNFVQFNNLLAPGAEIAWNSDVNTPYESLVEDNINLYNSAGTAERPILIHDNYVQGAYNGDPLSSQHFYGGGILIGDGPATDPVKSAHVRVYSNQVVGTLNYGLGIVGGTDMQVYGNVALGSGYLPDGRVAGYANTGSQIWNYYNAGPDAWGSNRFQSNVIGWTVRKADGSVAYTNWQQGYNCGAGSTLR